MIRKWLSALLVLALMIPSAFAEEAVRGYSAEEGYIYVTFGRYYQSIDGGVPDDGRQTLEWNTQAQTFKKQNKGKAFDPGELEKEPILWRVLTKDDEKVYLLSEFILFAAPLHSNSKEFSSFKGDFTKTDLWARLNGDFAAEAFTEAELEILLDVEGTGKISLPTSEDVSNAAFGFSPDEKKRVKVKDGNGNETNDIHTVNESRKAWATEYAIRVTGAYVYPVQRRNHSPYWMRDPVSAKSNPSHGRNTKNFGQIGTYDCTNPEEGVRPAVYLDPQGYTIQAGSGTREDPYVIVPKNQEVQQP